MEQLPRVAAKSGGGRSPGIFVIIFCVEGWAVASRLRACIGHVSKVSLPGACMSQCLGLFAEWGVSSKIDGNVIHSQTEQQDLEV